MLDARTMAVRRKLHNVLGRRSGFYIFAQKVRVWEETETETEGQEDKEVLRPVRNRRWQF